MRKQHEVVFKTQNDRTKEEKPRLPDLYNEYNDNSTYKSN